MISFKGDGSDMRIEATGLRGPFGLAFLPGTASLLVTDDGRDDLGARRPPDELDLVRNVTLAAPTSGSQAAPTSAGRSARGRAAPLVRLPAHAGVGGVAMTRGWAGQATTAFVAENGPVVPGAVAVPTVRMGRAAPPPERRLRREGLAAGDGLRRPGSARRRDRARAARCT